MWASVRVYARRYVATIAAIVVGVGFVVAINVLSSVTRNGLLADTAREYAGVGSVVSGLGSAEEADRVVRRTPGDAAVDAQTWQPISAGPRPLTDEGHVGAISTPASLRWQRLTSGAFPTRAGQAVADAEAAKQNDVAVGDRVTVGEGRDARTVTITGLASSSTGALAADVYLTWPDLRSFGDHVLVTDVVARTTDVAAVDAAVPSRLPVQDRATYLQHVQKDVTQGVDVIAIVLLVFAAIAFFVAAMVIANTFAILLAQRAREFALLRCVGATRRQIRRAVLGESFVVAVASSTAGVVVGIGLGVLLSKVGAAVFPVLPSGDVSLSPTWVVGAWLLGVVVTVVASLLPAARGSRVSPLAALHPDAGVDLRTRAGRLRIVLAALMLGTGGLLLAGSVRLHNVLVMIAGGGVSFVGVLLIGPVLVPACIRLLGLLTGRLGVPVRLATSNALRNPRRTAATTASLLVGVTLISGLVVGMATVRTALAGELDKQYPLDLTLTSVHGLHRDTLDRVRALDGVDRAVALDGSTVSVRQGKARVDHLTVVAPTADDRQVLRSDQPIGHPSGGVLYVPWKVLSDNALQTGRRAHVVVGDRSVALRVEGADGSGVAAVLAPATLARLTNTASPRAVWVLADSSADAGALKSAVSTVGWSVDGTVAGGLTNRSYVALQLDVMTGAVIALLAIGVAIALVGIGSTIGLSVLERTREHAVLRALGLTRRQLRGTLAVEALLLASVAGVLGVALGTFYAWIGVKAVVGAVIGTVHATMPVGQLLLVLLAAGLAGLLACVLPARRAARISPAAGLTAD